VRCIRGADEAHVGAGFDRDQIGGREQATPRVVVPVIVFFEDRLLLFREPRSSLLKLKRSFGDDGQRPTAGAMLPKHRANREWRERDNLHAARLLDLGAWREWLCGGADEFVKSTCFADEPEPCAHQPLNETAPRSNEGPSASLPCFENAHLRKGSTGMTWEGTGKPSRFARQWWFVLGFVILAVNASCSSGVSDEVSSAGGRGGSADGSGGFHVELDPTSGVADEAVNPPAENFDQALALPPPSTALACTKGSDCASGFCADGVCCDAPCDNICMACTAAKKGSGVDGVCGSIAYDTDPDNECADGSCDGKNVCKKYNGVSCTSTAQCLSNYCVDGYCCGNICMGECQACSAAKKGSGYNGVCGSIAANTDPDNECNPGECNGTGACNQAQTTKAIAGACTLAAQCTSGYCADGVCCDSWCLGNCQACTAAKKGQGVDGTCGSIKYDTDPDEECWGGSCDGTGLCKQYNGLSCSSTSQCLSGYCADGFCCGNVCTSLCYACSATKKGQGYDGVCGPIANALDPDNECNPGECNGSGACNQSQMLQANGTACASAAQCASGFCVDGLCCNTACNATCQACSATKKGSGTDGTCGNIKYDTDPDNECAAGGCSGNGTCQYYNGVACSATADCLSNYCVDGFCCGNICTGTCYACSAAKKGNGYDGVCGPIANAQDPDNECNPGECNGSGACNQAPVLLANGAACNGGAQCISGFCADGVCCDAACTGTCQACTATKKGGGTDGTCGNIKYDADPDNECASGSCSGSGTCQYYNGVACTMAAACLSNYCVDGVCCGAGCTQTCYACSAAKKGSGYDGVCGPIAIYTNPDNECANGYCNGSGTCNLLLSNGSLCSTNQQCGSGFCVGGICCNTACNGACEACNVVGSAGVCKSTCPAPCTGTVGLPVPPLNAGVPVGSFPYAVVAADFDGDGILDVAVANHSSANLSVLLNNGNNTFAAKVDYATGAQPSAIAAGDFDGDGNTDLVTANYASGTVSLLLNQGNGTFAAKVDYTVGSSAQSVSIADYDGDGKIDLAVAKFYVGVSVLFNQGSGTFGAPVDYPMGANRVAAGDLDGNGTPDLAVTDRSGNKVRVLLNQGNGTFGSNVGYTTGSEPDALVLADLNGDGTRDIAVANVGTITVSTLANAGNGTFAAKVDYNTGYYPTAVVAADMNADGKLDLVTSSGGTASVSVHLNGNFANRADYPTGDSAQALAPLDMNGDGKLDLAVTGSFSDTVRIMQNLGSGTFASDNQPDYLANAADPWPVVAADLNGDSKIDLATVGTNAVKVLFNGGTGSSWTSGTYTTGSYPSAVAAADFNGDGKVDLATANYQSISVLLAQGGSAFAPKVDYTAPMGTHYIVAADFTGDGKPDLATVKHDDAMGGSSSVNSVQIWFNNGSGSFTANGTYSMGGSMQNLCGNVLYGPKRDAVLAAADVDGDGLIDIAFANCDVGGVSVLRNQGGGSFGSGGSYNSVNPRSVIAADLNGDGLADLASANGDDTVTVALNQGGGTFAPVSYDMIWEPYSLKAADLNNDAKLDLVVTNNRSHTLGVLLNQGSGVFGMEASYAAAWNPQSLTTGDLNGDGRPDLAFTAYNSTTVSVSPNACLNPLTMGNQCSPGARPNGKFVPNQRCQS